MTLLWASWVALALLVVLLRAALGLRGLACDDNAEGVPDDRVLDGAAHATRIGADFVAEACRHAYRAHAAGERQTALLLFQCAQAAARAFARDLRKALADWRKSTWALGFADPIPEIGQDELHRTDLRLLAALETRVRAALATDVARLRLRLFVLGLQTSLLAAAFERVKAPMDTGQWTALQDLSADLAQVTHHALLAHRALRPLASLPTPDLSMAT